MATAEQSQPSELGLAEAADRFAALMDAPGAQPDPVKKPEANAEVEETEAAAEEVDETSLEDDEAPLEGSSEEEATDAVEATDGEQEELSEDTLVTVKIDGKTTQIPLKEAVAGYQRTADYSRKTAELAAERKAIAAEREQSSQLISQLYQEATKYALQEPDWDELHRNDPINYPRIRDKFVEEQQKQQLLFAQAQAEYARLDELKKQEAAEHRKFLLERGREYLHEKVPAWKDEKVWAEARAKMIEYGQKIGYSEHELSIADDPRAIIALDKARKYDALMAKRLQPQKQAGPKPIKGGSAAKSPQKSTDITRMKQRLKSSGHVNDAAALFGLLDSRRR